MRTLPDETNDDSLKNNFIYKCQKIHGNNFDYSKFVYLNNRTPSIIICPIHGEFLKRPDQHLRGSGCPKCSGAYKRTKDEFVQLSNIIHDNKYDYSKFVYTTSETKSIIICPLHGEFLQYPYNHLNRKCGCPICGSKKQHDKLKSNKEKFVNSSIEIHGNKYDYSKFEYIGCKTKGIIICPLHGEFYQTPQNHLIKGRSGCYACGREKIWSENRRPNTNTFISKAKLIHGDKYDYSKFEYVTDRVKSIIICPLHGEFLLDPDHHLNQKGGCGICGGTYLKTLEEFIKLASGIHNNRYDYSKFIYINSKTKGIIICPIHGEFLQNSAKHLGSHGCSICNESKGERKIRIFLENNLINFEPQKRFLDCRNEHKTRPLPFDFYISSKNLLIEYDGEGHYESVKFNGMSKTKADKKFEITKIHDKIKTQYCKDNNIDLLRIPYTEFDNIEEILRKRLFP